MRSIFAVVLAGSLLAACAGTDGDPEGVEAGNAVLQAKIYVGVDSGIEAIRFTISPCDQPQESVTIDRPIEDQVIPGDIPELQDNPLAEDSEHLFADLFQTLDAGCYDVHAQPLGPDGANSETCAPAWKNDVLVFEAATTEVFLLIQCLGHDKGAIDVIAAVNHEPVLDEVRFVDSKFVCGSDDVQTGIPYLVPASAVVLP